MLYCTICADPNVDEINLELVLHRYSLRNLAHQYCVMSFFLIRR
jgi:hypothetical protein